MRLWLTAFIDAFRFISRARERRAASLREEREHQLALYGQLARSLEIITEGSAKQAEENTKAITELARSSAAQAAAFSTWIASFQATTPPESTVVRDEDELAAEEARLADSLPEEFRLAFSLHGTADFMDDVKKDMKP